MLRNVLLVGLRNLQRQLTYSLINIIGLAVGLAASLVMLLYVYGEWSYDRHFANADRIYSVGVSFFNLGRFAKAPELLQKHLPDQMTGIEGITSFDKKNEDLQLSDKQFKELVYYVDSSFFQVFSYRFLSGDKNTAVAKPHSIVLSESVAKKLFGDENPVGQLIAVGKEKAEYMVTAIVEDEEANSHLKSKIWLRAPADQTETYYWSSASVYTYILLREGVSVADLRAGVDRMIENEVFPVAGKMIGKSTLAEYLADPNAVSFHIFALTDIYLKSKLALQLSPGGNEMNMFVFAIIAGFVLLLAAVNFINLSTARATRRAKEVGVRKSLGTSRSSLIFQFLTESAMVSTISMAFAFGLAELFSLIFYWVTGQQLGISVWSGPLTFIILIGFGLFVGLIAGLYPAFYLTSFRPSLVLKGNLQLSNTQKFRDGLVVFQFTISIALMIATLVIVQQLQFMSNKDLGFDQNNTLTIDNLFSAGKDALVLRDELLQHPQVKDASLHSGEPGSKSIMTMYTFQTEEMQNALTINTYVGDHRFLPVMGFKMIEGRNFNGDLASDTSSVILNESAVRALGLRNPIGATLNKNQTVIGVVSDFHWESLQHEINPVVIILQNERKPKVAFGQLALKLQPTNISALLQDITKKWKELAPQEPLQYHFLDDNFGDLNRKEEGFAKGVGFFTMLAILISCLGLFGLAAYTTEQRTKEIGIRKVMGASVQNLLVMLNLRFLKLVVIALLVSIPLAAYAAAEWLDRFAYRVNLSWMPFIAAGVAAVAVATLTVAYHSLRASQTNPSTTLKCE